MDAEVEEFTTPLVQAAVRRVAGKWRRFLAPDELRSIGWLWVHDHPAAVRKHLADEQRGARRLTTLIARAMDAAGRGEKAAAEGYAAEDEQFYSVSTLELLLPAVWDPAYRPWREEDETGRRKSGHAGAGLTWETMLADVRSAFDRAGLSAEQQFMLRAKYRDHVPTPVVAEAYEVSVTTVHNRVKAALWAIQDELGGVDPRCPPGCECHGGPGSRRVESTAASLARLEHAYDPS